MHGTEKDEQEELELKEVVKMIEVKWIIWVTNSWMEGGEEAWYREEAW